MAGPPLSRRMGFSLVEALVAITISTLVVFMAANVFLVQNDYYGFLIQRARVQENARAFLDVVEREVGSIVGGGLLVAEPRRMVIRVPQSLAAVCALSGSNTHVHWSAFSSIDEETATGYALRDGSGTWVFRPSEVKGSINYRGHAAAVLCERNGADTTAGGSNSYTIVHGLGARIGKVPAHGDIIMVYEEVELGVAPSLLNPNLMALFRGPVGRTATEYTTGVGAGARFRYRLNGIWRDQVGSKLLPEVDAIRIEAETYQPPESGIGSDARFVLAVEIPLKNR